MLNKIIIDTDPAMGSVGGDPEDSFAIQLALNSPEIASCRSAYVAVETEGCQTTGATVCEFNESIVGRCVRANRTRT